MLVFVQNYSGPMLEMQQRMFESSYLDMFRINLLNPQQYIVLLQLFLTNMDLVRPSSSPCFISLFVVVFVIAIAIAIAIVNVIAAVAVAVAVAVVVVVAFDFDSDIMFPCD